MMKRYILRVTALVLAMMLLAGSGSALTLRYPQSGAQVAVLQTALKQLGYYTKKIDGDFGSGTVAAVRAFQADNGLTVDGVAGPVTLRMLEMITGLEIDGEENPDSAPGGAAPPVEEEEPVQELPARTLRYGMAGDDVRLLQQRLYTLGYYAGETDGQFGSSVQNAVKAFQRKNGIAVDGVAGANTCKVLFSASAIAANATESTVQRTLRWGMEGADVKTMQSRLKVLGYYHSTADGVFGSGTLTALKQFQSRNGLTADGICGKNTREKLYSEDARGAQESDGQAGSIPVQTLTFGDKGEEVKALQRRLRELGYYTGEIDGQFGSATYSAVKRFQTRNGLTVDGKAGKNTLARLYAEDAVIEEDAPAEDVTPAPPASSDPTPTPTPTPKPTPTPMTRPDRTLRYGMTGEDVVLVQKRLIALGYLKITADGTYGNSTVTAVKAFQKAHGLTVDGVAGTNTYNKLFSDSAIPAPEEPAGTTIVPNRTLSQGDTGDDVKSLQQRLQALKYLSGIADGEYGSETAAAVKAFQQMNNLNATGKGNSATYVRLYSEDALTASGVKVGEKEPAYTNLKSGATGTAVIRLQQALVRYNYDLGVTGVFDDATLQAVRSFQVINGLSVDGVAGKGTQGLLYSGNAKAFPTGGDGAIYGSMGYVARPERSQIQLLHWADELKNALAYHDVLLAYDPATGISWALTIIARGRHCDVEPTAKADTAAMMAAFGYKETWTPKPVYVLLPDGRWTVATTHNVAHGINPIKDNDFEGQNCVHFLRDMSETELNDPNYGVDNQKALRKFWKEFSGQDIPYK